MGKNLQKYYKTVSIYDLLTKLNFKNVFEIIKITKICLNVGFKDANIEKKNLINIILFLKLITNQKPLLTKSKKNNIFLKIKKNSIIGCKMTLRNKNVLDFLEKLIFFVLPNLNKNQIKLQNKSTLNLQIKNVLDFLELKTEFLKFKNIPSLDISIQTTCKNKNELYILLNSLFVL